MTRASITRRQTLTGAAVVGVGVPLLAACGGSDGSGGDASDPAAGATPSSSSSTPSQSPTPSPSATASTAEAEPPADALTGTADVPKGGGAIFADEKVVVTQPTAGEFKCFTAVCTHSGCLVSSVEGGTINCACHGSRFSIADGSVDNGPARSGLSEVPISVQGGSISLA
jgi:nitrite reductase/ring-hydroxylating ferredoxin subunit